MIGERGERFFWVVAYTLGWRDYEDRALKTASDFSATDRISIPLPEYTPGLFHQAISWLKRPGYDVSRAPGVNPTDSEGICLRKRVPRSASERATDAVV